MILTEYDEAMIFLTDRFDQRNSILIGLDAEALEDLSESRHNTTFEEAAVVALHDWASGWDGNNPETS